MTRQAPGNVGDDTAMRLTKRWVIAIGATVVVLAAALTAFAVSRGGNGGEAHAPSEFVPRRR